MLSKTWQSDLSRLIDLPANEVSTHGLHHQVLHLPKSVPRARLCQDHEGIDSLSFTTTLDVHGRLQTLQWFQRFDAWQHPKMS